METPYSVQVKGHLPDGWRQIVERMEIIRDGNGITTLSGPIRDQAELYGLVVKLQNLGLTLISINQTAAIETGDASVRTCVASQSLQNDKQHYEG
jgi:hypothetical protein